MRLGQWGAKMSTDEMQNFIEACIDLGINDFDHADIYGHYSTEGEFGAVLKKDPTLRKKIQITTKCGIKLVSENRPDHKIKSYNCSGKHIMASVDQSLEQLHTDYIDILLIHRPDILMNPAEIAATFARLYRQGKVKYFGVSNFTPSQFELIQPYFPLITNQVEASILHRTPFLDGTFDQCMRHKIRPTCWSPLGGGKLFKEPEKDTPEAFIEQQKRIKTVTETLCEKYNASADQILLAWLLKHPARLLPVLGTSKIERIESALEASDIDLTHEEWYELWQASTGEEVA